MHEAVKGYIRAALDRRHPVDTIVSSLVSAGHDRETVRRLAREVIQERITELQGELAIDPLGRR
jgi:hypothetical protein